uniref:PEHE domain-containing protein n=1 Tax=Echinostoma caproni TaxID=27848 RepID=A0A183AXY6_9TREM
LRRNIRTHVKVVFDEEGRPIAKSIGGVPMELKEPSAGGEPVEQESTNRLDVERERQYLREVVDKKDRERWKLYRQEQNRLKRKKLKEARLRLQMAQSGVTLQSPDSDTVSSDEPSENSDPSREKRIRQ